MPDTPNTAIIGAGIAGLSAARVLVEAGFRVSVVDKGRGFGGRMATRRIGDARFDHGAQFFTVRTEPFRELVDSAMDAGVVEVWCNGFANDDGYPRYFCPEGMTALAKWLAADLTKQGVHIDLSTKATRISRNAHGWTIGIDEGLTRVTHTLLSTAPVPQTLDLLAAGDVGLEAEVAAQVAAIEYKRCLLYTSPSPRDATLSRMPSSA